MKKLLIIASLSLAAICANAATATWIMTTATMLPESTTQATGVLAYLFDTTLGSDTIATIASGKWDQTGYVSTTSTSASGVIYKTGIGSYENEVVSFSMIIFDTDSYATAENFKYAEVTDVSFAKMTKTVAFGNTIASASWQAIPEPTSGMLLLVGCALMALKRKRA